MSTARSERQRERDHAGRPDRIKAVTADLLADLDWSQKLPDIDGWVHGIKSDSPWTVQCDDCLTCFTDEHLILVARQVIFNSRSGTKDRLCMPCWEKRGWVYRDDGWEKR